MCIGCSHHHHQVFAFLAKSLPVLSLAVSFQFLTISIFRSSITFSCHRCLGLPTGLIPMGFQSNSFPVGLACSIHWTCPSHLILCALLNLTVSAPSVSLSISMLFRVLHMLSILTGPNIFRILGCSGGCNSRLGRASSLLDVYWFFYGWRHVRDVEVCM